MKHLIPVAVFATALIAMPVIAHHAAEGIVDEEIYATIDELVSDTPHADLTLDDLGPGQMQMSIDMGNVTAMEKLIAEELLSLMSQLDGEVTVTFTFTEDRSITMVMEQEVPVDETEFPVESLKAEASTETTSWGDVKAQYR